MPPDAPSEKNAHLRIFDIWELWGDVTGTLGTRKGHFGTRKGYVPFPGQVPKVLKIGAQKFPIEVNGFSLIWWLLSTGFITQMLFSILINTD